MTLTDHAKRNRAHWTGLAPSYAKATGWEREPNWGCWGIPDSELHLLDDVSGRTCSSWAVALPTSRRGLRGGGPGWSGSM
jgi:hypothetical protein